MARRMRLHLPPMCGLLAVLGGQRLGAAPPLCFLGGAEKSQAEQEISTECVRLLRCRWTHLATAHRCLLCSAETVHGEMTCGCCWMEPGSDEQAIYVYWMRAQEQETHWHCLERHRCYRGAAAAGEHGAFALTLPCSESALLAETP